MANSQMRVCIITGEDNSEAVFHMGTVEEEQHERAFLNCEQGDPKANIKSFRFAWVDAGSAYARAATGSHTIMAQ